MNAAISAMLVTKTALEGNFGIPGKFTGLLIDAVTPEQKATQEDITDEDTNPYASIFSERKFTLKFDAKKVNRSADIAMAYPGLAIADSALTAYLTDEVMQGLPETSSGRSFFIADVTNKMDKKTLDAYSFTLQATGYTLDRFPS